jgi:hypothetical protein
MARLRRRKETGPSATGPTFVMPPELSRADSRKVRQILKAELEKIKAGEAKPHVPFRFRHQLGYMAWLAAAVAGMISHEARAYLAAAIAAMLLVAITVAATRHRERFTRWHMQGQAGWGAAWAVVLAIFGMGPWAALALIGWAVPWAFWCHAYRWTGPAAAPAKDTSSTEIIWRELADVQKWSAWLGPSIAIPGGQRWPVICRGSQTPITKIIDKRNEIAAAFDTTVTQGWVEGRDDGVLSRGWLTLLRESTLDDPRPWDGVGIDPATGLAVVGRFPDGGDLHECYYVLGVGGGVRHTIVAGADGTGKTGMIDMGLCIAALSGLIAPVILDPQMGQALPAWQDRVAYACGAEDCMAYLRGLYAAMMARSDFMSTLRWKHPRSGRMRKGMGFFGVDVLVETPGGLRPLGDLLPIIEITIDEAPILLAVKGAAELVLAIAKLGRKVGFRLRLAAQVPSIAELGKSELRSILVGGNVFCFRTGDKVTGGMTNIPARPNELPKFFPSGKPTRGLGYADTIEARPGVVMRTDWMEEDRLYDYAETVPLRPLDESAAAELQAKLVLNTARLQGLAAAADTMAQRELAVLGVLTGPMPMGELITGCDGLSPSQVIDAAAELEAAGKARREGDMIEPVRT